MRIRPLLVLVVLLLAGCRIDGTASPAPDGWEFVSERPCAETTASGADEFSCVTLSVPVDHARPAGEHWDVTFGVHRAEGERRGVFVTSTGGPGSSGLDLAEAYSTEFPDELWRDFDVVFFDQRGIGLSQEFRCDDTYFDYYAFVDSSSSAADRDAFAQDSTRFGEDCFAEAGVDPATAPRYATAQAVEDLEDFRQWLDAPQLILYGESYGTQYVQTYAAAHPDRVERLVLDGVVDLTTDQTAFAVQQAEGISAVLEATLARCDADPTCAAAAPGDSLADYDALLDQLADDPVTPPGGYPVDDYTLRSAASASMSDPYSREDFTEALNDALNGDVAGLDELGNGSSGPTADFSEALYLAVECQDYDFVPAGGDPRAALDDWLGVAAAAGVDDLRLSYYYGDEDCLFWPGSTTDPDFARPEPVTDPPYPVLVLNSDTDANTPFVGARAVFGRLVPDAGPADAAIIQRYGPHVIYGYGDPCVDDPVHSFVETGELPAQRVTLCTW
ncbi:TAP-like protein [Klenkia soli]|uniref:TAP-like protein n=1 Tax=Klenkia soli TaxID=1052260 RepID=A0A1H0U4I6_9ACTN|nr:alpha/beta fold hydrolase [Klenkia soli]SDP60970.1 TAP-like protein [Klenkia soli]